MTVAGELSRARKGVHLPHPHPFVHRMWGAKKLSVSQSGNACASVGDVVQTVPEKDKKTLCWQENNLWVPGLVHACNERIVDRACVNVLDVLLQTFVLEICNPPGEAKGSLGFSDCVTTSYANPQCFFKHILDHVWTSHKIRCSRTNSFRTCTILCYGCVQSTSPRGPTTDRSKRRNVTSSLVRTSRLGLHAVGPVLGAIQLVLQACAHEFFWVLIWGRDTQAFGHASCFLHAAWLNLNQLRVGTAAIERLIAAYLPFSYAHYLAKLVANLFKHSRKALSNSGRSRWNLLKC